MNSESNLNVTIDRYVPLIEEEMMRIINGLNAGLSQAGFAVAQPDAFIAMLNYHLGFANADGTAAQVYSGKRIRPVLTLLCCEACGGQPESALPAAAAIELLHNFSLIHDDIEDRDELRRGRPTLWKLWGDAQAINSGDAMFTLAHLAMETALERGTDATRVLRALRVFDEASIALTIGQHFDLSFENRVDVTAMEYMAMIKGKTSALTQAACAIGAILAGAPQARINALANFGAWLGIAFQLQDDILGIWGDPAVTGKQDSDLRHHKKTLPVLYAAEKSAQLRELYFRQSMRDADNLALLRQLIDNNGGREYTEQAAQDAYEKSISALDSAGIDAHSAVVLRELAAGLLGRSA
ncbi:MAG: polyprenyl synthetase family protein [Chloroflexi bacterium]|nr:polyprenyl synthetase family protein [Chloroflexota bacterium]MCL5273910.1 polyprenyl synthetase family protein [Chloroflexota bacterium]